MSMNIPFEKCEYCYRCCPEDGAGREEEEYHLVFLFPLQFEQWDHSSNKKSVSVT